jgi:hypothetical protein
MPNLNLNLLSLPTWSPARWDLMTVWEWERQRIQVDRTRRRSSSVLQALTGRRGP